MKDKGSVYHCGTEWGGRLSARWAPLTGWVCICSILCPSAVVSPQTWFWNKLLVVFLFSCFQILQRPKPYIFFNVLTCKPFLLAPNFTLCSLLIILFQVLLEEPAMQSSIPRPWKVRCGQLGVEWEHQASKRPADSRGLWSPAGPRLGLYSPTVLRK